MKTNLDGLPKQSLGDVIDRITILSRKLFFGEEAVVNELTYLLDSIDKVNVKLTGGLLTAIIRIAQMNFEIWNRENAFRKADVPEVFEAEDIKKMMIEVRNFNSKRVEAKNEINRLTCKGFREFKIQHRSR